MDKIPEYFQQIADKYRKLAEIQGKTIAETLKIMGEINEQSLLRTIEETPKEDRLFWLQCEIASAAEIEIAKIMLAGDSA